jgi:LacI family transcriptional regulator
MQQKIRRVAAEMGYTPRAITTHTVAVVVDAFALWSDVTANFLVSADAALRQHGYHMAVSTLGVANMKDAPKLFTSKSVDGVLFTEWCPQAARHYKALTVPWLLLADADEPELEGHVHQVGVDTAGTAKQLTNHLINLGHQHFCVLTGAITVGNHHRVMQGVLQALGAAGLPLDNASVITNNDSTGIELEDSLLPLLEGAQPPTAIIAGSPGGALVALNRLQRNGYRVPEDVSVVSVIDGLRLTALRPAITATTATRNEQVPLAVERLIKLIKQPNLAPERLFLQGEIIERDSVAPTKSLEAACL